MKKKKVKKERVKVVRSAQMEGEETISGCDAGDERKAEIKVNIASVAASSLTRLPVIIYACIFFIIEDPLKEQLAKIKP